LGLKKSENEKLEKYEKLTATVPFTLTRPLAPLNSDTSHLHDSGTAWFSLFSEDAWRFEITSITQMPGNRQTESELCHTADCSTEISPTRHSNFVESYVTLSCKPKSHNRADLLFLQAPQFVPWHPGVSQSSMPIEGRNSESWVSCSDKANSSHKF
jgi:hypothetical protein